MHRRQILICAKVLVFVQAEAGGILAVLCITAAHRQESRFSKLRKISESLIPFGLFCFLSDESTLFVETFNLVPCILPFKQNHPVSCVNLLCLLWDR